MSFYQKALNWYDWILKRKPILTYIFKHSAIKNGWYKNIVSNRDTYEPKNSLHTYKQVKGWCLSCCNFLELKGCNVCNIKHVCQKCFSYSECFLDNNLNQLTIRTFRCKSLSEVTRFVPLLIKFYNILFPITLRVKNQSRKRIIQNKCRAESINEWYIGLLVPIQLLANVIKIYDQYYFIFGLYEKPMQYRNKRQNYPFSLINVCDYYDKLLLDDENFNRMNCLDVTMQRSYALNYLEYSRVLSDDVFHELKDYHFRAADYSLRFKHMSRIYQRTFDNFIESIENRMNNGENLTEWFKLYDLKRSDQRIKSAFINSSRNEVNFYSMDVCEIMKSMYWNNLLSQMTFSKLKCEHNNVSIFNFVASECDNALYEGLNRTQELVLEGIVSILQSILFWDSINVCKCNYKLDELIINALSMPNVLNITMLKNMIIKLNARWIINGEEVVLFKKSRLTTYVKHVFNPGNVNELPLDVVIMWMMRLVGIYLEDFRSSQILPDSVRMRNNLLSTIEYGNETSDDETERMTDEEHIEIDWDIANELIQQGDDNVRDAVNNLIRQLM